MADLISRCAPATFSPSLSPSLSNGLILSVLAAPVLNYTAIVPEYYYFNHPRTELSSASFCNVTISYTHPGENDAITVTVWLPISSPAWNGRLQAVGGSGWAAGGEGLFVSYAEIVGSLGQGFAAVTTDAGVDVSGDVKSWAHVSPGNPNLYALQNLATASLRDEALLARQVIADFFGSGPEYSYWSGCSQGGRQGLALAQRYPDLYDGIAAAAPALAFAHAMGAIWWPRVVVRNMLDGTRPDDCEVDALTALAVAECDALDGVVDGMISDQEACDAVVDPLRHVGKEFLCAATNATRTISRAAAVYVNATWSGPRGPDGRFLWYGPNAGSPIAGPQVAECEDELGGDWFRMFVAGDAGFDLEAATVDEFEWLFHRGVAEYDLIGTRDTDLERFRHRGGKIITFHGLADQVLPEKASLAYVEAVNETTTARGRGGMDDFYRYYRVPGLHHCAGGVSGQPTGVFAALQDWVERGIRPGALPVDVVVNGTTRAGRILCPYPQKAVWDGVGDSALRSSFSCVG